MPLRFADAGTVDEDPLAGFVAHAGFQKLYLNSFKWMSNDFSDFRRLSGTNLAVDALEEVQSSGYQFPSPALVADTMLPEWFSGKRRIRIS